MRRRLDTSFQIGVFLCFLSLSIALYATVFSTPSFDEAIVKSVKPLRHGVFGKALIDLSKSYVLTIIGLIFTLLAAVTKLRVGKVKAIAYCFIVAYLASITVAIVKLAFKRDRPSFEPVYTLSSFSMPSGHAATAAAFFTTLLLLIVTTKVRAYFLIPAVILTFLVGLSRIVIGVHYPTDVTAGWLYGAGFALIIISAIIPGQGFEPQLPDPESSVLPLDDPGKGNT